LAQQRGTTARAPIAQPSGHGDAGYAAVDALVALTIISGALVGSYQVLQQARAISDTASEARRAEARLRSLLEATPRDMTVRSGDDEGFRWRMVTEVTGADRPIAVCRRAATLVSDTSGRAYSAATLETCPVGAGS
jgi:hypothetical protein